MSGQNTKKVTKGELLRINFSDVVVGCIVVLLFTGVSYTSIAKQEERIAEIDDNSKPSCGSLHKCVALLLHFGTITFIINSSATLIKYLITQKLLFSIFVSKIIAISTGGLTALNVLFFLFATIYRETKADIVTHRKDHTLAEENGQVTDKDEHEPNPIKDQIN